MRGATAPVQPSQRRSGISHGLVTALRVCASAGLLALLIIISRDELSALDVGSKSAAAAWLTAAALVIAAAFVMAAMRWWQVAETLDVRVSGRSTLSIYLAALFVGNFLPTTIGGDVLRVNRLARICGSQANAFATVIIERLTGWVVLPLLTLAALMSQPSLLRHSGGQIAGGLALGTLVVLALIVWVAEHPRGLGRLAGGTRIREALGAVHTGLSVFRRHPGAAGRLLTVGLAYQVLLVAATALAGAAIGVNPGLRAWLAFAPMVLIVQNLSAIGGLGVREGALVLFLDAHGVNEGEAVLLGLLVYALTLLVSLTGAPALALGGRRNRSKVPAEVSGER